MKGSIPDLTLISQPNDQTLEDSFSSVSTPNFAKKRWKALDEIYKIYMLLHRSDLNISAKLAFSKLEMLKTLS